MAVAHETDEREERTPHAQGRSHDPKVRWFDWFPAKF